MHIELPRIKPIFGEKSIKETGREFELRVRRDLRKKGYKVSKAKSRHYDWLAERGGKAYLVECKCTTARLSPNQENYLIAGIKKGKKVIIARKTRTGRINYKRY